MSSASGPLTGLVRPEDGSVTMLAQAQLDDPAPAPAAAELPENDGATAEAEPVAPSSPEPPGETLQAVEEAMAEEPVQETFFTDTYTWTALALIVLIVIIWRPAKRAVLASLDGRAERIRAELDEAQTLREEAQTALASYQRRQRDAMTEAEAILAHAREEAARIRANTLSELEETLKRREAQALERINQAEASAAAEVRAQAVDIAIAAARRVLSESMDPGRVNEMTDRAIDDLPARLN